MTPQEKEIFDFCSDEATRAAMAMQAKGAPLPLILDRLITYALAQAVVVDGSEATAANLRTLADRVDAGFFHSLTGEGSVKQ